MVKMNQRFWWTENAAELETMVDQLGDDARFWTLIRTFLDDHQTEGRELAYELQLLCQQIKSEQEEALRETKGRSDRYE